MTQIVVGQQSTPTPFSEFLTGARDSFPLIVGAIPFGIIYGTLAVASGLSFVAAMAMSTFVFAGSAQFIAVGLVAVGTGAPFIIMTTFVVNLRHALYSATLAPYVTKLPQHWQVLLAFLLTDETFAVVVKRYTEDSNTGYNRWYYLGSGMFMYLNWQFCTFLGLTLGQMLPDAASWGLDFAMVVTFIGMTIPYLKNKPMIATVAVAGSIAIIAHSLPHQLWLIVATVAGIATGVVVETLQKRKVEAQNE